jgi:hypothetical protein
MKKKPNNAKLQLNSETLRALEQLDLTVVNGAASDLNSCPPCNTRYGTCLC